MAEPGKLRGTTDRHWVGLLLLLAIASHANDGARDDLALQGTVVDAATGLPVVGAKVRHLSLNERINGSDYWGQSRPGWSATTDDEGHFTLANLPTHDTYLQVTAAGYADSRGIHVSPDTGRLDIRLGQGATIDAALSLVTGGAATGTVWLSPASEPWAGVRGQVDAFGHFRFEHVAPGPYRLTARSSSGIAESRDVRVAEGDHVAVELSLDQLGKVAGWISGLLEGESASIAIHKDDESQHYVRGSAREFGNGRFELHGVVDGTYVVKARAGKRTLSTRAEVTGGDATVAFAFAGRSRLSGRVLAGTRPIPGMPLRMTPLDDAMPSGTGITDEMGRFEFTGLDDGEYDIEVQLGVRGTWRSFPVTLFGETVTDVRLGRYSISGSVGPEAGSGIVQARFVGHGDEPVIHTAVFRNGKYRFDGLDQGDYLAGLRPSKEHERHTARETQPDCKAKPRSRKLVTHGSPYLDQIIEVRIFAASVEGVALSLAYGETIAIQVVDAESGEDIRSLRCDVEGGSWAGTSFGLDDQPTLRMPVSLIDTGLTCTSVPPLKCGDITFVPDGEPGMCASTYFDGGTSSRRVRQCEPERRSNSQRISETVH